MKAITIISLPLGLASLACAQNDHGINLRAALGSQPSDSIGGMLAGRIASQTQAPTESRIVQVSGSAQYAPSMHNTLRLNFAEEMIDPSLVGSDVSPEIMHFTPAAPVKIKWVSSSCIEITLTDNLEFRSVHQLLFPAGNLKSLKGTEMRIEAPIIIQEQGSIDINRLYAEPYSPVFIRLEDTRKPAQEAFKSAIAQAYYREDGNSNKAQRYPAIARPLSLEEAQKYAKILSQRLNTTQDSLTEEDIKDIWMIDPFPVAYDQCVTLYIPELTSSKIEGAKKIGEQYISRIYPSYNSTSLYAQGEKGKYQASLNFNVPIAGRQLNELLPKLAPLLTYTEQDAEGNVIETTVPMSYENGLFTVQLKGASYTLTPNIAACEAEKITLPNPYQEGTQLTGYKKLYFTIETNSAPLTLRMFVPAENIRGELISPEIVQGKEQPPLSDRLAPPTPYLSSNILAGGMLSQKEHVLRCEYRGMDKLDARVYVLDNSPANAVRVLNGYYKYYTPAQDYSPSRAADAQDTLFPTDLLTGVDKSFSTTLDAPAEEAQALKIQSSNGSSKEQKVEVDLAGKFARSTMNGFYFVEFEGKPTKEWIRAYGKKDDARFTTQEIVQITDLGLMWKQSGNKMFIYAYSLSTGAPIPAAQVLLMSADGSTLATVQIQNGCVITDIPADLAYIHISHGNDSYITRAAHDDEYKPQNDEDVWVNRLLDVNKVPQLRAFIFNDRGLYRPGETAHVKGYLRELYNNDISMLQGVESITAQLSKNGDRVEDYKVELEDDGSFALDINIPAGKPGHYSLGLTLTYHGDGANTAPDKLAILAQCKEENKENFLQSWLVRSILESNREVYHYLRVQEFRRDEFEIESSLEILPENKLKLQASAMNFSGVPVANGAVNISVNTQATNFYPAGLKDYRFGDYTNYDPGYWEAYYSGRQADAYGNRNSSYQEAKLDAEGKLTQEVEIPELDKPSRSLVNVSTSVTNANEQTIRSSERIYTHPADTYIGLQTKSKHSQGGENKSIELKLLAVDTEGKVDKTAGPVQLKVTNTTNRSYRYGGSGRSNVRNEEEKKPVFEQQITPLEGQAQLEIPALSPGEYTIEVEGKDAKGKAFYSAITHYVWGGDYSPWAFQSGSNMELTPDKESYKAGDTAKILVQNPVEGEALVTIEREDIKRSFYRTITHENPIIEVPLGKEDAPNVYVSVFMVQNATGERNENGMPLTKAGSTNINIEPTQHTLSVELYTPEEAVLPGEECDVVGRVLGADGKPLAHANVTLYAEDEGTLQTAGYQIPNPLAFFYYARPLTVKSYSTLGQFVNGKSSKDFGNKGVFIGGGDDCETDMTEGDLNSIKIRENFKPCALWLARVKTDEQGRFVARYANPDTLTRYSVMAIVNAGESFFGNARAKYVVNKPIMLEASAPLSATKGDTLDVPVTVSILPDQMPQEAQGVIWKVSATGSANLSIEKAEKFIRFDSNEPKNLSFRVNMQETGDAELQWTVQAVQTNGVKPLPGKLALINDGVKLSFPTVPATPYLREAITTQIEAGQSISSETWVKTPFGAEARAELLFSPSPISGAVQSMERLLQYPYGCTEQICSTTLPWIFSKRLTENLGLQLPKGKNAEAVVNKSIQTLLKRQMPNALFSYWDSPSVQASEYSAYAVITLIKASENKMADDLSWTISRAIRTLKSNPQSPLLGLYAAALAKQLSIEEFDAIIQSRTDFNQADFYLITLVARLIDHPKADQYLVQAKTYTYRSQYCYATPPVSALIMLEAIARDPQGENTTAAMREYVLKLLERDSYGSTWERAWMCLVVDEYLKARPEELGSAQLNGQELSASTPLRTDVKLADKTSFAAGGKTVYVTGMAEGYLKQQQEPAAVNKGFLINRRYEKLMPDGTWSATGEFIVGDVVRIHLDATASLQNELHYLALEDYLPATFELINPELPTQSLPPQLMERRYECWSSPSWMDNKEYLKDRVRFFASRGPNGAFRCSYLARVVKSGTVTAPAAKAELMYRPEQYGLSIPQQFIVKPRPSSKL